MKGRLWLNANDDVITIMAMTTPYITKTTSRKLITEKLKTKTQKKSKTFEKKISTDTYQ
jgi:hypothetical protein